MPGVTVVDREWPTSTGLAWRPGAGTLAVTTVAAVVALWLFSPTWWTQLGQDSGVYYAAAHVVRAGGNPYDPGVLAAMEHALSGSPAGPVAGYANPPLFTALLVPFAGMPARAFWGLLAGVGLLAGLIGLETIMTALAWKDRGWPRAWLLASPSFALALFLGNVSPVLLGIVGVGILLASRGRSVGAGLVLSLVWLKPSVGLPLAAAVIVAGPGGRRGVLAVAMIAGTAVLAALDVLLTGAAPLLAWLRTLSGYSVDPAHAAASSAPLTESNLAGLPPLFSHAIGLVAAEVLALVLVGAAIAFLLSRRGWRRFILADRSRVLALAILASLLVMPFSHLNDLEVAALPLLAIAAASIHRVPRLLLALWLVGPPVAAIGGALLLHAGAPSTVGIGLPLVLVAFAALAYEGLAAEAAG